MFSWRLATTFRVVKGLGFMEAAFICVNDEVWVLGLLAKKGYVKREIKMCSNWNWSKKIKMMWQIKRKRKRK